MFRIYLSVFLCLFYDEWALASKRRAFFQIFDVTIAIYKLFFTKLKQKPVSHELNSNVKVHVPESASASCCDISDKGSGWYIWICPGKRKNVFASVCKPSLLSNIKNNIWRPDSRLIHTIDLTPRGIDD